MKVKPKYVVGILILLFIISTTTYAGGARGRWAKFKESIKYPFTEQFVQLTKQKLLTNSLARIMYKVFGYAPVLRENDVRELLKIALYDADLMKIAATKKLESLYRKATDDHKKKTIIDAILKASVELIKYYGAVDNDPLNRLTLFFGLNYVDKCLKLSKDDEERGICFKRKTFLFSAYMFSHRLHVNSLVRDCLRNSMIKAKVLLSKDAELKYMELRIVCEIKLMVFYKSKIAKSLLSLPMGKADESIQNTNCVDELQPYKDTFANGGTDLLEFYYLWSRAYEKEGRSKTALKLAEEARNVPVVGETSRRLNKKIQTLYEKLYLKLSTNI